MTVRHWAVAALLALAAFAHGRRAIRTSRSS